MDILVRNECSDQEESFNHVIAGRVSSVSSPFSKIGRILFFEHIGGGDFFEKKGVKMFDHKVEQNKK